QPEGERPSVEPLPLSRRRPGAPAMVTLTLLDGTTVQLPRTRPAAKPEAVPADESLTARDLVAALRAAARDVDVSDILPEKRWEPLLAALLAVLLRKQLIADWEFVEEWKRAELT
ncbi:MAG: hypothetical protein IT379_05175, partial [Deltaproteobacteria bacterium]|nr:hypothetical protein [Deltaproteobacteria bacterium]